MKKIFLTTFAAVFCGLLFSCQKMYCDEFHEGPQCAMEIRSRYYGKYNGMLSASGILPEPAMVVVAPHGGGPRYIFVDGLSCFLLTPNSFQIQHPLPNGQQIYGNGFFSGKKISYWCKFGFNGPSNEYTGTFIF